MKHISQKYIRDYKGSKICRDIYHNGTIFINENTYITDEIITKIENTNDNYFFTIFIEDESTNNIKQIIKNELTNEINKKINFIMKRYSYSKNMKDDLKLMNDIVFLIIKKLTNNAFFLNYLENLMIIDWNLFSHVIRVSVLSLILAIKADIPFSMIQDVCIGAILHDIGRIELMLDFPKITEQKEYTNSTIFDIIKTHPIIGFEQTENNKLISLESRKIILAHHVWEDRKKSYNEHKDTLLSYPLYYQGNKVDKNTKDLAVNIVQVANTYDILINDILKENEPESLALEFIKLNSDVMFTKQAAKLIYNYISPYPIGIKVRLSDYQTAEVINQTSITNRPIIRLNDKDINLSRSHQNLNIIGYYNEKNNLVETKGKDVYEFDRTVKDNYYV
jgi:HD superfamily phosphodiesterase